MSRVVYYEDFRKGLGLFREKTNSTFTDGGISDPYPVTNGSDSIYVTGAATSLSTGLRQRGRWTGTRWESSLIDTRHNFWVSMPFRVEHRFNVAGCAFASYWPTLWFKGKPDARGSENVRGKNWPSYIELDAWEYTGNTKLFFTIHGDDPYGSGSANHWMLPASNSVTFDQTSWHIVAMEVRPGSVQWFLDGVLQKSTNFGPNATAPAYFPFDWKWYPILNLAIGSNNWVEVPNAGTPGTTTQQGDYLTDYVSFIDLRDSAPRSPRRFR